MRTQALSNLTVDTASREPWPVAGSRLVMASTAGRHALSVYVVTPNRLLSPLHSRSCCVGIKEADSAVGPIFQAGGQWVPGSLRALRRWVLEVRGVCWERVALPVGGVPADRVSAICGAGSPWASVASIRGCFPGWPCPAELVFWVIRSGSRPSRPQPQACFLSSSTPIYIRLIGKSTLFLKKIGFFLLEWDNPLNH